MTSFDLLIVKIYYQLARLGLRSAKKYIFAYFLQQTPHSSPHCTHKAAFWLIKALSFVWKGPCHAKRRKKQPDVHFRDPSEPEVNSLGYQPGETR